MDIARGRSMMGNPNIVQRVFVTNPGAGGLGGDVGGGSGRRGRAGGGRSGRLAHAGRGAWGVLRGWALRQRGGTAGTRRCRPPGGRHLRERGDARRKGRRLRCGPGRPRWHTRRRCGGSCDWICRSDHWHGHWWPDRRDDRCLGWFRAGAAGGKALFGSAGLFGGSAPAEPAKPAVPPVTAVVAEPPKPAPVPVPVKQEFSFSPNISLTVQGDAKDPQALLQAIMPELRRQLADFAGQMQRVSLFDEPNV